MRHYQKIVANFTAKTRKEKFQGKEYLVVPTVMITEGVHSGSEGPILYEAADLKKNPTVWNMKPVVINHPVKDGEGISACNPDVIEASGVGMLMNTHWHNGGLKTESWLDPIKLAQVAPNVLASIQKGEMVEVSTGLYHDPEEVTGTWNNETYKAKARNILPDHLAILPNDKGACSIADGAGLLRNADGTEMSHDDIRSHLSKMIQKDRDAEDWDGYAYVTDVYPKTFIYEKKGKTYQAGYSTKGGKVKLSNDAHVQVQRRTSYVTMNGKTLTNEELQGPLIAPSLSDKSKMSDVMRRQQVTAALENKFKTTDPPGAWNGWVTELFDDSVIWMKDSKMYRLPYAYQEDSIMFKGDPEEVEQITEYRNKTNTPIDGTSSSSTTINKELTVGQSNTTNNQIHSGAGGLTGITDRKAKVNNLMGKGCFNEADRDALEALPDATFTAVESWVTKGINQPTIPYNPSVPDRSNVHNAQTPAPVMNVEQYLASLPPGPIRDMVAEGLASRKKERNQLVANVLANPNNKFSKEWLENENTASLDLLRGLSSLASTPAAPVNNYEGQGGGYPLMFGVPSQVHNAQGSSEADGDDILTAPVMNFSK